MKSPLPPLPDPIPLREALRSLRHVLRSSGERLADTLPLPGSAGREARRAGEELARGFDRLASGVARRALAAGAPRFADLATLIGRGEAGAADFARLAYMGLVVLGARLGLDGAFVSEAAARQAFVAALPRLGPLPDPARLGEVVFLELLAARVIRDGRAPGEGHAAAAPPAPVCAAVFALVLWLLGPAGPTGEGARFADLDALRRSLDDSRALMRAEARLPEITAAVEVGNGARLRQIFALYAGAAS